MNNKLFARISAVLLLLVLVTTAVPAAAATNGARGEQVIRVALQYLGRPYVFGARGTRAFDCSGFTRFVYQRVTGKTLPHSAALQTRYGRQISKGQLQRGDLIFFKNTYKAGISHVGIYYGNNRMIHAWPKGGVRIDSLNTTYFRTKYHSSRTYLR